MEKQNVVISHDLEKCLSEAIARCPHDRLFVLTDTTTVQLCWPIVQAYECLSGAQVITIGSTDDNKTLESLCHVWESLQQGRATRHSLLVNLGGGMVTDLGGFAASTFKRGIPYINIPTTLLSMVDASVGGKTGINFGGFKNEIGVFNSPSTVILDTRFLATLDYPNIASGYAEMLKHGLISDVEKWSELVNFDIKQPDTSVLGDMVGKSVAVKERVVTIDPTEKGLRKVLNLGHTIGHALESLAMEENRTVLHGYAVAWGLVAELYLSCMLTGFPTDKMRQTVSFIKAYYGTFDFTCDHYEHLYELMKHDKKNVGDTINFALLGGIGDIRLDMHATKEQIFEALDFLREG
ncbi:MAG: 3-dehydroquinate synthase [Bacteroidaceae bacterium]|nr:3-dehydroquinate synthase [Bacteroidaceae bacterium]